MLVVPGVRDLRVYQPTTESVIGSCGCGFMVMGTGCVRLGLWFLAREVGPIPFQYRSQREQRPTWLRKCCLYGKWGRIQYFMGEHHVETTNAEAHRFPIPWALCNRGGFCGAQ